ncbi:T9SS C-terminal target domain-containing protein [bacterium]|nr:MAG: T9SS C-terminal target domain-containing protein [bacterium]
MKHALFFSLFLLIASSLYAGTGDVQEIYFSFEITERSELEQLTRIVSIDNVKGNIVYAYGLQEKLAKLMKLGYEITELPNPGTLIIPEMAPSLREMRDWDYYPTYGQYIAMMYQFATDYPSLCRIVDIGSTVEGRQLLFAVISDNVSIEEDEPEFMYTATMHGDETTGYVLMLRLIDYLLSGYGFDPEVTEMVNKIEIWINPLANPDGTYHGGNNNIYGARRVNSNGVDLNRNFPDPEDGPHPDGNAWQIETIAMMDLAEAHSFIHSANFHGGAEVVNYPWDTWAVLHADDDWYYDISRAYADTVHLYAPAGYMTMENNGITNGYAWYTINGGRQDYMNWFQACREVTIEISNTKLLPESQLDAHWIYNKRSFIKYIQNVYYGIRGIVTDSLGNPLDAMIMVGDHDFNNSEVFTDPDVGNYHRMLSPGVYDITVSAYGFIDQTITNITVTDTGATRVDVELQEAQTIDITGVVRDGDTNAPIGNATVEIMDSVHDPVQTDFTGFYAIDNVMEGTYTFKVSAAGYSTLTEDITVTQDNNVINFELYAPYLFWDFEQNDGDFTSDPPTGGWQWGEPSAGDITAYSGIKVWATNLSGFYVDDAHWYLDSPEIQLGNNPMLEFYHLHYFEEGYSMYDGGNVSISTNYGGSFSVITPIGGYDGNITVLGGQGYGGTRTEWTLAQFSLAQYANQVIVLRWHFASDNSVHDYYGWYVDDVAIIELVGTDDPVPGNNELVLGQNFPNPFRNSTTISFLIPKNLSESTLKIFNLKGQLVSQTSLEGQETSLTWNGKDMDEKPVTSGVYFYQIKSKNYSSGIKKMIYLQK